MDTSTASCAAIRCGEVSCSLFGQCTVSDSEKALIDRYKVGEYILASYILRRSQPIEFNIKVNDLISGATHRTDDIETLLKLEEEMKSGCNNLKALLARNPKGRPSEGRRILRAYKRVAVS